MEKNRTPSALITGAGRGLGRDLTEVFIENQWTVYALVRTRNAADSLKTQFGEACRPFIGDVSNGDIGTAIADALQKGNQALDVLINNAGVPGKTHLIDDVGFAEVEALIKVHCLGALNCLKAALPWLRKAERPQVINVSSRMGSLTNAASDRFAHFDVSYSYRIAKAAQNMLTVCLSQDSSLADLRVLAVHPGRLTTRIAGKDADVPSREAAEKMFSLVTGKTEAPGLYFDLITGERFDW